MLISYSHDSDSHKDRVLQLAQRLRRDGVDVQLDAFVSSPPQGWPRWMHDEVMAADFVVLVCTRAYRDRFEGFTQTGRGVSFEGLITLQLLYDGRLDHRRVVAVVFDRDDLETVPIPVRPGSCWVLGAEYPKLLGHLRGAGAVVPELLPGKASTPNEAGPTDAELRLTKLREQREEAIIAQADTRELDDEILQLRREIRESPNLDVEDILLGRYRLIEQIGKGGFATVWKAFDRETQRIVAVKALHVQWAGDRSRIERFEGGARKMKTLHHGAIVPILDGPHQDGHHHFFVMPWFKGGDLRRAIAGGLDGDAALDAVAQAVEGLAFAHDHGFVHRDVKPDNILLDEHGKGYIADFDLVRDAHSTAGTHTHAGMGSFVYAAQELLVNAKDADSRADVYGVGMTVLFALLRRDPPALVAATQPRLIGSLSCDARLRAAVLGAVAYERDERTTTCEQLVMAIRGRSPSFGFETREPGKRVEISPIERADDVIEAQLSISEQRFRQLTTPLDDPARVPLWAELGNLHAALQRSREAALCWSRALWEPGPEDGGPGHLAIARRWVESERKMFGYLETVPLLGIVDVSEADLDDQMVRALAAEVVYVDLHERSSESERVRSLAQAPAPPVLEDELLARLSRFFDANGSLLDLRTLWLARRALARLSGNDFGLFQCRDVIMASLREGFEVARNIPIFVRTHGGDVDDRELNRLGDELTRTREEYFATPRKRSTVEASYPNARTDAYVRLVFAWGFARIGRSQAAREELDGATGLLGSTINRERGDAVHVAAYAAYRARVEQALQGMPPGAPFSAAPGGPIATREHLVDLERFKYDRLVQTSGVLDPRRDVDAFENSNRGYDEPFAGLALLSRPEALAELFDRMLVNMQELRPDLRARALGEVLEYVEVLPERLAVPRLRAALPHIDRAPIETRPKLLRNALLLAGYYERSDLIRDVLATLARSDPELITAYPVLYAELLARCAPVLRGNYEPQLAALLSRLEERVTSDAVLGGVLARLHIAAAFASLGLPDRLESVFAAAHALLGELSIPAEYKTLLRELSVALSRSTPGQAIAGARALMERLATTTDGMSTNSHYCLAVIDLMEAVVTALASEDRLVLSEWLRCWVEDDEHLLRRRIRRDLAVAR